jgi:hypothetical protein
MGLTRARVAVPVMLSGKQESKMVHESIELDIQHVISAKLYLEGAARVVHVWTDLSADQVDEVDAFRRTLNCLRDDHPLAYDKFAFYLKGSPDAHWS